MNLKALVKTILKEEVHLSLMAALEQTSSHPLAVGVLNKMEN